MTANCIAINIALLPDQAMVERARMVNTRMLEDYPEGFALDDEHLVHVTLLQAFVRQEDLASIWTKVQAIPVQTSLQAEAFDFHASGETGAAGFDVSQPSWLKDAHRRAVSTVSSLALSDGDRDAFYSGPDEVPAGERSLEYVRGFVSAHGGDHYNPHVTLGIGRRELLESLRQAPFEPFDFRIERLAICHLGNHGTCRRVLFSRQVRG